mmetsp:Transcript_40450/g.56193  ORF Transcript_40450/g.56193 Transcript_40450/m.56193 type:complete len:276 (+) Transcript_40450:60-887(+)|eukprot:CAMPEP_0201489936 /NCGR_PEP_ID=MMETSP0151_2-20130828/24271_1 /ASSEMBLY_ACC=CAM_ASM_000257 /TAXON_ID=200890 /ORGANISM="Paramoeba atlantica, Strain 621/1 / CCAP 1560/9" /LENGTH=275 /DNA_ID=CAMNT_0047875683 /DNA_START=58 /DNA_END=885 /DNA_ORIENTATION=-
MGDLVNRKNRSSSFETSRDLDQARRSYRSGDEDASRLAHSRVVCEQGHKSQVSAIGVGRSLKTLVLGTDASLFLTFLLFHASIDLVPSLGCWERIRAVMGLTLGIGFCLSFLLYTRKNARMVLETNERLRETWEYDNFREGEIQEMVELYTAKGLEKEEAAAAVQILSKHKDFFVDLMMLEELEITPYRDFPPLIEGALFMTAYLAIAVCLLMPTLWFEWVDLSGSHISLSVSLIFIVASSLIKEHYFLELQPWWQISLKFFGVLVFILGYFALT